MNAPVHTKTFKSGNSVAVRLPKGLGIGSDELYEVRGNVDRFTGRRIPNATEEAARLARWREGLAALKALPKPSEIEPRERIEFPDRPGL